MKRLWLVKNSNMKNSALSKNHSLRGSLTAVLFFITLHSKIPVIGGSDIFHFKRSPTTFSVRFPVYSYSVDPTSFLTAGVEKTTDLMIDFGFRCNCPYLFVFRWLVCKASRLKN